MPASTRCNCCTEAAPSGGPVTPGAQGAPGSPGLGPAWPPASSRQPVPHEAARAERGTGRLHLLGQWFPEKDFLDGCWFPDQNRLTTTSEDD